MDDVVPLSFFLLATASVDFWRRGERIKVGRNLFDIERGSFVRLYVQYSTVRRPYKSNHDTVNMFSNLQHINKMNIR
jgi:hypothetical protein